ncbi:MAG TPA: ABC transporter permease [Candidatus Paceibacterota bacterium]|nr:ABC transporter permease [Verrucomicrobiota bacterium]HRY48135.1 ABC transporter permease [Candidatus Paceibacterota bacterium]
MKPLSPFWNRLRSLWQRRGVKRKIGKKSPFHFKQRTRRSASLGEATWQDVRFGARRLRREPAFTVTAMLTLALCIGANLAIFAVVEGILLRPLPFPEPERLVAMFNDYPKAELGRSQSSFPNLYNRRDAIAAFSCLAAYRPDAAVVGESGAGQRMEILRVSADFFETLGFWPMLGRSFTEEEMTFQTHHVAILTEGFWRQNFGASRDALGRTVRINGFNKTIVGVLPAGFRFLSSRAAILLPLSSSPEQRGINSLHNSGDCELIARLKPGATVAEAQAQIEAQNLIVGRDFAYAKQVEASGFRTVVAPLHADHVAPIRPTLILLQAGGLLLLVIGLANLVNLLLVRASARASELAIRQSLGATWAHVARQIVTETVLLTLIGGLCGIGFGYLGVRLLSVFGVDRLPLGSGVVLDGQIVFMALAGAAIMGVAIAIPVAAFVLRSHLASALHTQSRGDTGSHAAERLRHGFVVAQIALAFVLLSGAGLLAVNLKRTMEISPGFRPDAVLAGHISMLHPNYFGRPSRLRFAERAVETIAGQPGVRAAGIANNVPVGGKASGNQRRVMTPANRATVAPDFLPLVPNIYGVVGDFFRALGIPLKSGSLFDGSESRRDERVCIVDETFARRSWGDTDPIGQWVYDGPEPIPGRLRFRVIGLVGAVKQTELTEPANDGTLYFPFRDSPVGDDDLYVVIRTDLRPEALAPLVQRVMRGVEPELPVNDLRPMETRIADTLLMRRSPALLSGLFAAVALLLSAVGTYGVLSFAVARRRREIGVRMALGALPFQIGWQYLWLGLRLFGAGMILGAAGATLAGRAMQGLLSEVPPFHPGVVLGTAAALGIISSLACLLPALRAASVDPMEALGCE